MELFVLIVVAKKKGGGGGTFCNHGTHSIPVREGLGWFVPYTVLESLDLNEQQKF